LVDNGDGTWDYTPAGNNDSGVTFSYTITDGIDSVAGSATLDITPVNDAPSTTPVTLSAIAEDSGVRTITQAQLLANAGDIDGPSLTATGLTIASGSGALVDNGDGTWDYTPAADDDSSVSFSYTITDGTDNVAGSATLDITPVNDAPAGVPTISGWVVNGQTLTADTGGISDADGLGAFSYQWLRNGVAIGGATGSTYTLGGIDVGSQISVQVSYVDADGTSEGPLTSAQTGPVANMNNAPVGLPTITGTVQEDQVLAADTSGISDADGLGAFSYQWLRDGVDIGGATASTYTLGDADVGSQISAQVSYLDGNGTAEGPLASAQTAAVSNVNDAPTGGVGIDNGTPVLGDTLKASNNLADNDGVGTVNYQWQRNGANIAGATGASYTTTQSDVGAVISVLASYTDGEGTFESISSSSTGAVTTPVVPTSDNVGGGGTNDGGGSAMGDDSGDAGSGNDTSSANYEGADAGSEQQTVGESTTLETLEQESGPVDAATTLLPAGSGRIAAEPAFALDGDSAAGSGGADNQPRSSEIEHLLNDESSIVREGDSLKWLTPEWLLVEAPQIDRGVSFVAGPVSVVNLAMGGVSDEIASSGGNSETMSLAEGVQFASIALTAGAVTWAIQAGGLLTSLLVSMPVWREFDPLPVVTEEENKGGDDDEADDAASDEEAVAARVFAVGQT
jgi:hypothetical protein